MNDNIGRNIANLDKRDTYSLLMILLNASSDNPRYSTLNELVYILDHDSLINFITYYEGMTISIPTIDEIRNSIRTLLLFQYYKVDKLGWHEALEKAGFSPEDSRSAKRRIIKFVESIEKNEYRLGGIINERDYNEE